MMHPEAERWNRRYRREATQWLARPPRQLLLDHADLLPSEGLALDSAAGVAANGLFLAERGLHVVALDISDVSLRMALDRARARNVRLEAAVCDLSEPWLPCDFFDVILNFRFLERATITMYRRALKPGGLLFFETFVTTDESVSEPVYYLSPGELRHAYRDWRLLHWSESTGKGHDSKRARHSEQLIVRKP
jgi:SAM-dependent methyltransferase